jgi:folate-binding protein YgfZ
VTTPAGSALEAGDLTAYRALHDAAALVDRSARVRMTFSGAQAKAALGGLLTNDVAALVPGSGLRAAALTPKGRVIALVRVADRGEDLLVDADAAAGAGFGAMIRKFVNPRLATYADVTAGTRCLGVYGPRAADYLTATLGVTAAQLAAMDDHAVLLLGEGAERITVLRSADLSLPGFDCIAGTDRIDAMERALTLVGVTTASAAVTAVARVEAGVPQWGIEMDEETIPQEANLDALGAISFSKGCYTGQEVVARIHFRGHVNRHLRWLSASEPIPVGATVVDASGKELGTVRSSVISPRRGPLAIAMVRREILPGSEVLVRADSNEFPACCEEITVGVRAQT